jgi:hypothetical protein
LEVEKKCEIVGRQIETLFAFDESLQFGKKKFVKSALGPSRLIPKNFKEKQKTHGLK